MKKTDDGGPAFPYGFSLGMSLRDYFAAQALRALRLKSDDYAPIIAKEAYAIADAMIEKRK